MVDRSELGYSRDILNESMRILKGIGLIHRVALSYDRCRKLLYDPNDNQTTFVKGKGGENAYYKARYSCISPNLIKIGPKRRVYEVNIEIITSRFNR